MWEFLKRPDADPARGIGIGFTDARDGATPPTGSLSFGAHDGGPEAHARNVDLLCHDAGLDGILALRQVHSARVHVVDPAFLAAWDPAAPPEGDGLVCDARALRAAGAPAIALAVRAADCVPVVLADPATRVIAVVHAGRAGLLAGIIAEAVAAMRHLGAHDPAAWIGPHIHACCYEVPAEMADRAGHTLSAARGRTSWGTPAVDLTSGVHQALAGLDVPVVRTGPCTFTSDRLHSHRRDAGRAGRQLGLVWAA